MSIHREVREVREETATAFNAEYAGYAGYADEIPAVRACRDGSRLHSNAFRQYVVSAFRRTV